MIPYSSRHKIIITAYLFIAFTTIRYLLLQNGNNPAERMQLYYIIHKQIRTLSF